jgi:hypothetical protein
VSINTRVRVDVEIQHQRHRTRRHSRGNQPTQCPHIADPGSLPPVAFSLCGLCKRGQQFDQPPSFESSWHPSGRYKCRGGPQADRSETSCKAQTKLLGTVGHDKCLLKVFERLKVVDDLVCQPILGRDGGNIGNVLPSHDVSLMEAVQLRIRSSSCC